VVRTLQDKGGYYSALMQRLVGGGTESQKNHSKVKDNPEKGMIMLSTFIVTRN
jgi:hypothetical protein